MMKLSKVTTRNQMIKLIAGIAPMLSPKGEDIANYWLDALESKEMQVKEIKTGLKADLENAENFKSEKGQQQVLQSLGLVEKEAKGNAKGTPKADAKDGKKEDTKKTASKEEAENIKLVGYRYVRPIFPEVLNDLEGYTLKRVDTNNIKDLADIGEENLVFAVFFPEWESGNYIDPVDLLEDNVQEVLQKHGFETYPNRLDLQQVLHLDTDLGVAVTLSFYTELPYTMALNRKKWFSVNKTLNCRVNNYGHDYAIYKAEKNK